MIEEESQPVTPKPTRRRFQYSLRTLLLVTLLGGPVLGWVGSAVKEHLREPTEVELALQWLREHQDPEGGWDFAEDDCRPESAVCDDSSGRHVATCIAGAWLPSLSSGAERGKTQKQKGRRESYSESTPVPLFSH